jgi:NAD dependent epimerase/dehydratase
MTHWQGRQVLITGAGGFIGSHLTELLLDAGAKVRVLLRYNARGDAGLLRYLPSEKFAQIERFTGDLLDYRGVLDAAAGVDTIFHLGALIAIPYSYKNPVHVIHTNVLGTTHVLEAARLQNVRRVVHTSTSEVYGTARYVPIDEAHPLQGQSPYSASKIAADKIVESYVKSFGVPAVTVRPFNTYGPRQSARAVIPTIIMQALSRDFVKLGDLRPTRDLTFATDTARGFMLAAQADQGIGQTVNLGGGFDISIGDLAQKIIKIVGKDIPIVEDQSRLRPPDSEVMRLHADNRLAAQVIGWTPQVSLDEGLTHTVEWIRANLEHYRPDEYAV